LPTTPDGFAAVVGGAYHYANGVSIAPTSSASPVGNRAKYDRRVVLPIPDAVYLAGQLLDSTVYDADASGNNTPRTQKPYVVTILAYNLPQAGGTIVLQSAPSGPAITLNGQNHLLFSITNNDTTMTDPVHIPIVFNMLMKRIPSKQTVSVSLTSAYADPVNSPLNLREDELGIQQPAAKAAVELADQMEMKMKSPPGQLGSRVVTAANCAGGGISVFP
jgi:hypothetical protein